MSQVTKIYDAMFGDEQATQQYVHFIENHQLKSPIFECAIGSGTLALKLQNLGYEIDGLDMSEDMVNQAKQKGLLGQLYTADMSKPWNIDREYQTILCVGDSINYLVQSSLDSFFSEVYKHLKQGGIFVFDMHTEDRLKEFNEPYIEEAIVDDIEVVWTCSAVENALHHQFIFYHQDGYDLEEVTQQVFSPEVIALKLKTIGFKFKVYTDFTQEGLHQGEKLFYVCTKELI